MTRRQRCDVVDATGTRRRLEALAAIGYPAAVIAAHMNRPPASSRALIYEWRRPARLRIDARTARDVAQVYEQLKDTPGPNPTVRINALRAGFLPPTAWQLFAADIDDPNTTVEVNDPRFWPRIAKHTTTGSEQTA